MDITIDLRSKATFEASFRNSIILVRQHVSFDLAIPENRTVAEVFEEAENKYLVAALNSIRQVRSYPLLNTTEETRNRINFIRFCITDDDFLYIGLRFMSLYFLSIRNSDTGPDLELLNLPGVPSVGLDHRYGHLGTESGCELHNNRIGYLKLLRCCRELHKFYENAVADPKNLHFTHDSIAAAKDKLSSRLLNEYYMCICVSFIESVRLNPILDHMILDDMNIKLEEVTGAGDELTLNERILNWGKLTVSLHDQRHGLDDLKLVRRIVDVLGVANGSPN